MAKLKKSKIGITSKVQGALEKVDLELKERGAKNYELGVVLERLIESDQANRVIDEFVNDHTPESYKLSCLLDTPGEREKLLELLQDKNFGMSTSNGFKDQPSI